MRSYDIEHQGEYWVVTITTRVDSHPTFAKSGRFFWSAEAVSGDQRKKANDWLQARDEVEATGAALDHALRKLGLD